MVIVLRSGTEIFKAKRDDRKQTAPWISRAFLSLGMSLLV